MSIIERHLVSRVREHLETFRVVVLDGARQTGKTTLVREILRFPATFTFDDPAVLSAATTDPVGFVGALPRPSAIDEFQRAGSPFLLAVKHAVDRDRSRGQLLLTGSASYRATRGPAETLPGRSGRLTLWPLSQGEQRGERESFLDLLFEPEAWPPAIGRPQSRAALFDAVLTGGFPEIVTEGLTGRRRHDWFQAYVADVVSREALRPLADVRMERELRRMLRLLAARTSQELVISDLAADAELNRETVGTYVGLLEALHLVHLLPAWATSATTRAKRRPKIHLIDTGLAADLCGYDRPHLAPTSAGTAAGSLLETFVIAELAKQATWGERDLELLHFRDRHGAEIDVIVEERRSGRVAAIEVKATETPMLRDARHIHRLRERLGSRFALGLVLHAGTQVLPLGDRVWAVPVSTVWRSDR